MDEIVLFLIMLLMGLVVVPILCLIKLVGIDRRLLDMEKELKGLKIDKKADVEKVPEVIKPKVAFKPKAVEPEVVQAPKPTKPPVPIVKEEKVVEEVPVFTMLKTEEKPSVVVPPPPSPKKKETIKRKNPIWKLENLLSKIGIVTLVLGIGFFVKYAIDKDWINEVGRVAIGVLIGGVLIGIAHKLRKKYNVFSAIMVGGGISVLYITITLAFREYELFSQTIAFILLIIITLFSVLLSLVYDRKELALFSLLGGFASPLLISTGTGNYMVLFSFLFILNSGMLLISMRKRWSVIGIVSFVCTLLFYWGWLLISYEGQRMGALVFAILFFVQFYLLAVFSHLRSGKQVKPFQVMLILANNLSAFAASLYVFNDLSIKTQGLITITMAVVNAMVMVVLFKNKTIDKRLIYLLIAIVLSFVSLAVPVQLNGHVITMFWAAEIVILLWMWNKTNINVFRTGFFCLSASTLISYLMDVEHVYRTSPELPIVFNRICMTGFVLLAAFALARWLLIQGPPAHKEGILMKNVDRALRVAVVGIAYLVPFFEIWYQFNAYSYDNIGKFIYVMLALYTLVYAAAVAFVCRKRIKHTPWMFWMLFASIIVYLVVAIPELIDWRYTIFYGRGPRVLLWLTNLALPALAYIYYVLVQSMREMSKSRYVTLSWLLVASSVVVMSVTLDHVVILLWGEVETYIQMLYEVHTFGYPILWGVMAMALMVWGLKAKAVILRQISLGFFAFIILKFYINDIWRMSQTGRIISFVALGVILLVVSFLMQKIKVWIKDDEKDK